MARAISRGPKQVVDRYGVGFTGSGGCDSRSIGGDKDGLHGGFTG